MAIAIDGSGTITGISVGGLPDGIVDTDMLDDNAVTFGKIGTTEQGQLCKAWVSFDGTGTVAIRAAYNVSSITDNGTGDYTVNFTTAMSDANYSVLFTPGGQETTSTANFDMPRRSTTPTTSAVRVIYSNGNQDTLFGSVAIFR